MYLVVGLLGLTTYIFTAVFVYMSEKDLEHHVTGVAKKGQTIHTHLQGPESPPLLPMIDRTSGSSNACVSFEQFRKDGFVDIDLEHQAELQTSGPTITDVQKDRKKPRMILFN